MRSHIAGRRDRLNARLAAMIPFITAQTQVGVPTPPYPTYTQAKRALKLIPRKIREDYEKEIRGANKKQIAEIEQKRKELRASDTPSERTASKKAERKAKRGA